MLSRENDVTIVDIEKKIDEMQIQLLKLAGAHADITQVTKEIYHLRDEKQKAQVEYDENLVRRLIDEVIVYEDDVAFRSGVMVKVEG